MTEDKKYMFQYAYDNGIRTSFCSLSSCKIVENTELITLVEALNLWDKYYDECIKRLQNDERPQMCIWKDCKNNTDYGEVLKEIDWRDNLEIKNGRVYKKELKEIV